MGRFDALTQIEEPKKQKPVDAVVIPVKANQTKTDATQVNKSKKTTKPLTRLPTNQASTLDILEKPEKYTTHIFPSLVKKVKLHAVEKEINDYDVINKALLFYFDNHS